MKLPPEKLREMADNLILFKCLSSIGGRDLNDRNKEWIISDDEAQAILVVTDMLYDCVVVHKGTRDMISELDKDKGTQP